MTRIARALLATALLVASSDTVATVWSWSFIQSPNGLVLRIRGAWHLGCDPADAPVTRSGSVLTLVAQFPVDSCGPTQLLEKEFPVSATTEGVTELRLYYAYALTFTQAMWHYTAVEGLALPSSWNCCTPFSAVAQPGVFGLSGSAASVVYVRTETAWSYVAGSTLRRNGDTIQIYIDAGYLGIGISPPSQTSSYAMQLSPGTYQIDLYQGAVGNPFAARVATSSLTVVRDASPVPISAVTPLLVAMLLVSGYIIFRRMT